MAAPSAEALAIAECLPDLDARTQRRLAQSIDRFGDAAYRRCIEDAAREAERCPRSLLDLLPGRIRALAQPQEGPPND